MRPDCPHCKQISVTSEGRIRIVKDGKFWRKSDGRFISKFRCLACFKHFSNATFAAEYRQNKRHKNHFIKKLLTEGNSQRGIARLVNVSRTTVVKKFKFLGGLAEVELERMNALLPLAKQIQFDDQETAEGSKYRPVAISLAVLAGHRWIYGTEPAAMPVKWKLTGKKLEKYGGRKDERGEARAKLFERIKPYCRPDVEISTDLHPHYPKSIRAHFPQATHIRHRSRKPVDHGQDELKKGFDELFSLNHTCAMHRDRIARLTRKSWCLSKKREPLRWHLAIYAVEHNKRLKIWEEITRK